VIGVEDGTLPGGVVKGKSADTPGGGENDSGAQGAPSALPSKIIEAPFHKKTLDRGRCPA